MIRRATLSPRSFALLFACGLAAILLLPAGPGSPRAEDAPGASRTAPGPVHVAVTSRPDGKPVGNVFVHLGGRVAATGADGSVVFDGVPAGDVVAVVEDHRFERLQQSLRLPPGHRNPLSLALTPAALQPVTGRVTLEQHGGGVAGARILVTPVAVAASQKGPSVFTTTWDGTFRAVDLPPGRYRADISAAGCVPRTFDLDVAPDMKEAAWKLARDVRVARLAVTLRDAANGKPLPGAKVILAEAGMRGRVAEGSSGDDGGVVFRDLQLGRLNWEDSEGSLAVSRRAVTVRAEREGYETAVVGATLDASSSVAVSLNPAAKIAEAEPDNDAATATAIRTGAPVEFRIDRVGDRDCFRFRLDSPANIRIAVGPKNAVETWVVLLDAGGQVRRQQGALKGGENAIDAGGLPAGEYVVQVDEWNNNDASPDPMTLTVTATRAPDALEPDDRAAAARVVQPGEEVRGCILPMGDVDWFRFEVKRPSHVRVTMPGHPLERYVFLRDAEGRVAGQMGTAAGAPLELVAAVEPGTWTLDLHEWNDNAESTEPYLLRLETIEDDGIDDPRQEAGRPAAVRLLEPGDRAGATIFPTGDADFYTVPVPHAGRFHAEFVSVTELYLYVKAADGRVLAQGGAGAGSKTHVACDLDGPATLFLELHEWNDNDCSESPYSLSTWFESCDELELAGRDDLPATAIPVELGEPIRASIYPVHDVDWFRLEIDHPGRFRIDGSAPTELYIYVRDGQQRVLMQAGFSPGSAVAMDCQVLPGPCLVEVHEWNDNDGAPAPYVLTPRIFRAEPAETVPLATDPIRPLKAGEAQAFGIDHVGDRDRFSFAATEAGKFTIRIRNPIETYLWLFDDQTGTLLHQMGLGRGADGRIEWEAKGPTRYRLDLREWNDNDFSLAPAFVLVDAQGRDIPAETFEGKADPNEPTKVMFSRAAVPGMPGGKTVGVDADGDGKVDLELGSAASSWSYKSEGLYRATAFVRGENGVVTRVPFWVEATGPRERKGVYVVVDRPSEGQVIEEDLACEARAISYSGAPIAGVSLDVDGRPVARLHSAPWTFDLPWRTLGGGDHVLAFTATDLRGEKATVKRKVRLGEYFDLQPRDGATLSGNAVHVSWTGTTFGAAKVRFRAKGEEAWREAVGQSGRARSVALPGLEPGKAYEVQPLGGGEPGPVRTVTRVKGLAFGKAAYAASIRRDYDQRAAVSVRNHGDKPQTVRLECGRPPDESRLLAGFVGDGSEGAPFVLAPGEEREFLLGLSAQDCVVPRAEFPIRLVSTDGGTSDGAVVTVDIQLPRVDLAWEEKETAPDGLSRRLLLRNNGDPITDLAVASASADLYVTPLVEHGFLPARGTLEVRVAPRLHEGFREAKGRVVAKAVNKSSESEQAFALKDGSRVYLVELGPAAEDPEEAARMNEAGLAAAYMNPGSVDWSRREDPRDTDGNGRPDRWTVDIPEESTRWTGSDTDGDGEVDLAQADIGPDGRVDFSAVRGAKGWEETNLVDAHLEMGFKLPWNRSAYEKHDLDIVMNGVVVGRLRDRIPEGNYTFPLPPSSFRFNDNGSPDRNEVRIQSKHLRGGHYVVSSDFRMKVNLTRTRAWAVGTSQADAEKSVRGTPGLVLDAPDLSVCSEEIRVDGEPRGGAPLRVSVPLRNLGAGTARRVVVALRFNAGGDDIELARTAIPAVPPGDAASTVELAATAPSGDVVLKVVVDPEKRLPDCDRDNNEARAPFKAAGDTTKPSLGEISPAEGARLDEPVVALTAKATDDAGMARMDVRVDQGLWAKLSRTPDGFAGRALLQPGAHRLTFRALDTSGNADERTVTVTIAGTPTAVEILEPAEGAKIEARRVKVALKCGPEARRAAVRVNGGPWRPAALKEGRAEAEVDLTFGNVVLEAAATDARGVRGTATLRFNCGRQATEEDEAGGRPPGPAAPLDVPGLGPVDPFGEENPVVADPEAAGGPDVEPPPEEGQDPDAGPIASPEDSAENRDVPDDPGEDGQYGGEPPEGMDPAGLDGLEDEEAALDGPDGDSDEMAAEDWLNDPDADTAEDPELADPPDSPDADYEPPDMESWDEMPEPAAEGGPEGGAPGAGGYSAPPGGDGGSGGGYVGVQQRQSDWYCTNRPEVGVGFQMPDWLKKLNLPKPGTARFEKEFQDRLAALKARGVDTSKLEAFRKILQNRCGRLDSPEELPSFLQSLGLTKPNSQDPAALKEWRDRMASAADSFMLRLLHSNDPSLIAAGLRARADALGQFDQATKEAAEAAIETIKANQKITEDFATIVPYLNVAISARALWTGESITGEKLGKLDVVLHSLSLLGPAIQLFRNPTLRKAAASIANKAMWAGEKTIGRLAAKMGVTPERLRAAVNAMSEAFAGARIKAGEKLFGKVWAAEQRFLNSPAGREAAALAARDVKQAEALLHRIAQARAAGDKAAYRRLISALQGNKTAQGLLNTGKYSNQFRAALDKTHRAMGRLTDKRTIAELMKNDNVRKQLQKVAERYGVKVEEIVIRARNVSGNVKTLRNVKPGELLKYGADRDVVYQFVTKKGKTLTDVHHKLVEKVYEKNLRAITGRSLSEMDHVVTSRWHPEAYNPGKYLNQAARNNEINNIITGRAAGRLNRPTDIRDTVIHKGREWMEAGHQAAQAGNRALGNQKVKEGMRQMIKEYDRQVAQFLQAKGLSATKALPPRLRVGLDIFRKVQKGATVEQAREMLKALTPKGGLPVTPETIADDLGNFVEYMNRWGLKTP